MAPLTPFYTERSAGYHAIVGASLVYLEPVTSGRDRRPWPAPLGCAHAHRAWQASRNPARLEVLLANDPRAATVLVNAREWGAVEW
jgi:hypothetical protein